MHIKFCVHRRYMMMMIFEYLRRLFAVWNYLYKLYHFAQPKGNTCVHSTQLTHSEAVQNAPQRLKHKQSTSPKAGQSRCPANKGIIISATNLLLRAPIKTWCTHIFFTHWLLITSDVVFKRDPIIKDLSECVKCTKRKRKRDLQSHSYKAL